LTDVPFEIFGDFETLGGRKGKGGKGKGNGKATGMKLNDT